MKLPIKILLINCILMVIIAVFITASSPETYSGFFLYFGLAALVGGLLAFFVSIILFLVKEKEWGKGFLLSAGVLLLLGFAACSTAIR